MPITNPQQIFTHALDFLKGWFHPHALDFVGKLDPATDATAQPVYGGRVVHVSSNAVVAGGAGRVDSLFQLGAVGGQVAIFLIQGQLDYDVSNFGNVAADPYGWQSIAPAGWQSGLVALGSYELQTTEFDQTVGVVYAPNDPLHAVTEAQITTGTDKSSAGMLFKNRNWPGGDAGAITRYTDNVCAVVSRGVVKNQNRVSVLTFWPCYLPTAGTTA